MNVDDVAVFLHAVTAGSLSGAARHLKISPMVATRRLAALEAALGVRLLHRTTRASSLTAEGEAFLPYASRLLEEAEAARAVVAPSAKHIRGRLRVTCCGAVARTVVVPVVTRLLVDHPGLEIDLIVDDEVIDIVSNSIDVAIRIGDLAASTLVGSVIGSHRRGLFAAPEYLVDRSGPMLLEDLANHECLMLSGQRHWQFRSKDAETSLALSGRFTATSIECLHDACLGGAGIAILSRMRAAADVVAGRLVEVALSDAEPKEQAIHAVFPPGRQVLPKAKLFVDTLRSVFREDHVGGGKGTALAAE